MLMICLSLNRKSVKTLEINKRFLHCLCLLTLNKHQSRISSLKKKVKHTPRITDTFNKTKQKNKAKHHVHAVCEAFSTGVSLFTYTLESLSNKTLYSFVLFAVFTFASDNLGPRLRFPVSLF